MSNLGELEKFFIGGEAEAEAKIRTKVFIDPPNLQKLLNFNRSRYKILLAPKGVGKSLLLYVLHESLLAKGEISLVLTPKDINCQNIYEKKTVADKISEGYRQVLISIGATIGNYMGTIVSNDESVNLLKLSIDEGLSRPDIVSRFSSFLTEITPKGKKIAEAAKKIQNLSTNTKIIKSDIVKVLSKNEKNLWLFIDDIDQASISKQTGGFDYSTCWALVSAAMDLANDFENVRCLISIRHDIWHTMTVAKKLGSERLDKITKPFLLSYNEKELEEIFLQRVFLANKELDVNNRSVLTFFEKESLSLPGKERLERLWSTWIAKTSRNRPRDLVHLIQFLIDECESKNSQLISQKNAWSVMAKFGKDRIKNIEAEYQQICPQIKAVIGDLQDKTLYEFKEVIDALSRSPSSRRITVDGETLAPNSKDSALSLLRILHMANFINARANNPYIEGDYVHITFQEEPDLIDADNWNHLQKFQWEIHPTFHSYIEELRIANWKKIA